MDKRLRPRNPKTEPRECNFCGTQYIVVSSELKRGKGLYCSHSCAAKTQPKKNIFGEKNPNWKGGISDNNGRKRRYRKNNPLKHVAHKELTRAIKSGKLKQCPCEVCGEVRVDGHHPNYNFPNVVTWLCRKHHLEEHYGKFGRKPVSSPALSSLS